MIVHHGVCLSVRDSLMGPAGTRNSALESCGGWALSIEQDFPICGKLLLCGYAGLILDHRVRRRREVNERSSTREEKGCEREFWK